MSFEPKVAPEVKKKVVDLYRQGKKVDVIVAETGVPRSSVYYLLQALSIQPKRKPGPKPRGETAALLELLREKDETIARQREEIGRLKERLRKS